MAKTYKIYTAGKMSGKSYAEQMQWRKYMERVICEQSGKTITFVHPPMFYNYNEPFHKTERELYEWELSQIISSDVVIVDLRDIRDSISTHMELGAVAAANIVGNKRIFVVGIGELDSDHPWIKESTFRIEKDFDAAAEYISDYLLI